MRPSFVRLFLLPIRLFLWPLAVAGLAVGQAAPEAVQDLPTIGVLDFFGLNKVQPARVRSVLGVNEGGRFPASKGDIEEKLVQIPGVVQSHLEAVCCDAGKTILYVGLEERGAPHFDVREPPESEIALPAEITALYREFIEAVDAATRRGVMAEDLTRGYSLMADPLAREIQQKFPDLARNNFEKLVGILRTCADDEQRAIAAYLIGYEPRQKPRVSAELQYALRDADMGVRAIAVRGLIALAVYARLNPDEGVKIQPTWFVEMLNSLSWSDRNHAMRALQILTDGRDASSLDMLRERALPALVEMSRWKTLPHALPAVVLLGRVAGMTEEQIQDAWTRGDREAVIAAASGKKSR